jgi:ankyrin repeat protein
MGNKSSISEDYNALLINSCFDGNLKYAKKCMKKGVTELSLKRGMWKACENGHLVIAKWCAKKHLQINPHFSIPKYDYNTAFINTCKNGHLDVAKWCVENGADNFNHVLTIACTYGQLNIVKFCVNNGANRYYKNDITRVGLLNQPFNIAHSSKNFKCAKVCYDNDEGIVMILNEKLVTACKNGHIETAKQLVEKGATNYRECLPYATNMNHGMNPDPNYEPNVELAKYMVDLYGQKKERGKSVARYIRKHQERK